MKLIDGKLYLTTKELCAYGYSEGYLWKVTHKYREGHSKSYANIESPDDARICLIDYDTIPADGLEYRNIPTRQELVKKLEHEQLRQAVVKDSKALDYYLAKPETHREADELQEIAAWLMAAAPANRATARHYGHSSVNDYYSSIIDLLNDMNLCQWNVKNLDRFIRKLSPFYNYYKSFPNHFDPRHPDFYVKQPARCEAYEDALASIISKKKGLRNAAKLQPRNDERGLRQTEEQRAKILEIWKDCTPKLTEQEAWVKYMRMATERFTLYQKTNGAKGWDEKAFISRQTMFKWLFSKEVRQLWKQARDGEKAYRDAYEPITTRIPASFANAKWVIDGTPAHLYFMKDGKPWCRLNIFFVIDEHSWAIVGYSASLSENTDQVIAALRDACIKTGCMPHEIQSDNGPAIKSYRSKHAINTIAKYYKPSRAKNARSKIAEPFNAHFNRKELKFEPGFSGNPFAKSETNQINKDALAVQVKQGELYNYNEVYDVLDRLVLEWNNNPFNKALPIQKYNTSLKDSASRQLQFTNLLDIEAFYYEPGAMAQVIVDYEKRTKKSVWKPREYTFSALGIAVQKKDELTGDTINYLFDVPEAAFRLANYSHKFTLKIEPQNFSRAYLFHEGKPIVNELGEWVYAGQKELIHSAQADHLPGEGKRLQANLALKEEQMELRNRQFDRFMEISKSVDGEMAEMGMQLTWDKIKLNQAKAETYEAMISPRFELPSETKERRQEPAAAEAMEDEDAATPAAAEAMAGEKKTFNRFDI